LDARALGVALQPGRRASRAWGNAQLAAQARRPRCFLEVIAVKPGRRNKPPRPRAGFRASIAVARSTRRPRLVQLGGADPSKSDRRACRMPPEVTGPIETDDTRQRFAVADHDPRTDGAIAVWAAPVPALIRMGRHRGHPGGEAAMTKGCTLRGFEVPHLPSMNAFGAFARLPARTARPPWKLVPLPCQRRAHSPDCRTSTRPPPARRSIGA